MTYEPAPKYRRADLPGYGDCTPPNEYWDALDADADAEEADDVDDVADEVTP